MRLAFVVQRYGAEVNGGAELHCRLVAEHLAARSEVSAVTVFTSCAIDYRTWANHYSPGVDDVAGIRVERFAVPFRRFTPLHDGLGLLTMHGPRLSRLESPWLIAQGPYLPDLLDRLTEVRYHYDAFIFFTYLYYPTVRGMQRVRERAVLVPTAHDEPQITQRIYRHVFSTPRALIFNTPEERDFVDETFDTRGIPRVVVGCGIDLPEADAAPGALGLGGIPDAPFILSVGRLSRSKGVGELCAAFVEFKRRYSDVSFRGFDGRTYRGAELKLVLAGRRAGARIPDRSDVVVLGFVSDVEKEALLARAEVVIVPSRFESLSLVVLESWAHGKPVLVNGRCAVTRGLTWRGGGGDSYDGESSFGEKLESLLKQPELRRQQGAAGRRYVEQEFAWSRVEDRLLEVIERAVVRDQRRGAAQQDELDRVTFGVITNGRRPEKLLREMDSILELGVPHLEVLVAGSLDPDLEAEVTRRGARYVREQRAAAEGRLGRMRNALVEQATHPIMVIADDDMIFHADFHRALRQQCPNFDALAVGIQNADGSRFWDYATKGGPRGHRLLDYDMKDNHTYITGGLIVAKREVLAAVRWDDARGFYEDEDVDFSQRLRAAGYVIGFCREATVTHDDWRYYQRGHGIRRLPAWRGDLRRRINSLTLRLRHARRPSERR